ncbi:MAG: hypothetical protein A07HN63_01850 [uncultured archaeon A07HN63]|nr:MAG: hypothetical protein A07HN63_01850 [uncultured archaeon A07HN63]
MRLSATTPTTDPSTRRPVEAAIERHDLLATGGSDAHDETLGLAGPPADTVGAFRTRLRKAVR